jgi:APA family basic amino acid/polyamine antiporter
MGGVTGPTAAPPAGGDADTALRQAIRLPHATAMVVGTIIGASIFVQPSEITGQVPTLWGVLLVWAVAGALTLIGALVCAELASTFPRTGGVYVYLKETYHPAVGFLWGWAMLWSMHSGIIAAIAVVFARYTAYFVPLGEWGTKGVAIAAILVLSAVNYVGVRHGTLVQTAFTAGKLVAVAAIIVLGMALGGRVPAHFVPSAEAQAIGVADVLTALVAALFAFGGWHMVTYNAGETVDARRTIPRALIAGTLIVTVSYVGMNAVYMYVLPIDTVATSTRVAADLAEALLGFEGGALMSGVVMFSTFGALSGVVLAGPRVYYSMARDGLLFGWMGAVHPRFHTPHRAVVLQAAVAALLVATGTFRALFTRVIYTEWIFFALLAAGLILLRRRPDVTRGYSAWGYPVAPVVFVVMSAAIVVNQLVTNTADAAAGLGLVLLGLPIYLAWTRYRRALESTPSP